MIPMRDGVNLATDVYYPAAGGERAEERFPVILERILTEHLPKPC